MKKVLKLSVMLTWFNLIVWGFFTAIGIIGALLSQNFSILLAAFLTSVVVLHSYASLQLQKSIKKPSIPLGNQTPVGIRFIGFIALFFAISSIAGGIGTLQNLKELADSTKSQLLSQYKTSQYKNIDFATLFRFGGIFSILVGLCIAVNVNLGFRLLRWYYLTKGIL